MVIKVLCKFTDSGLRFATQNFHDSSGNWQNKIINISTLNRNIGEDKSYEISGITIEFNDTDRYFRTLMSGADRFIAGKKVELLTENDELIYTGVVEKWVFKEDAFQLNINDRLSGLETMVPKSISLNEYPNLVEKAEGASIPIIYGILFAASGAVKCWRVDTVTINSTEHGKYLLADHHCKLLTGNKAYTEEVTDGFAANLDNHSDGRAYVTCVCEEDFIYVNVEGKKDSESNLIEDPMEALMDIIDNYTEMSYNLDSLTDAQIISSARGYNISCVIDNHQTLQNVLVEFCFSFDCDFYIGKDNEIMITLLNWSSLSPIKSYTSKHILELQIEESPEDIRNKVQYKYQYNYALGEYQRSPIFEKNSSIQNWGEFFYKNEALDLRYVSDSDAAYDVVQRYVIQRKNPPRKAQISLPLVEFLGVDISDIIEIQHPGAIDENKRKYQVRRVNIDFISDSVQLEAIDITTLTGGMFILGSRTDPKLAASWELTDDYSKGYGYLADKNDFYFSNNRDYGKVLY
jgi:hypothetical protein